MKRFKSQVSEDLYWQMRREDIENAKPKDFSFGRELAFEFRDNPKVTPDSLMYLTRRSGASMLCNRNLEMVKAGMEYQISVFEAAKLLPQSMIQALARGGAA